MGNFWGIVFGLILICFGLGAIAGINVWRYFFPILLILVGLSILFNQTRSKSSSWQDMGKPVETHESTIDYSAVFSGVNRKVASTTFQGGKISAVFGGANVDLRDAKIAKNATVTLEANAVFGGVKILVPKTWDVQGNLTGVFGGFDNSTTNPDKAEGKLIVKGSAVFGGGEIQN